VRLRGSLLALLAVCAGALALVACGGSGAGHGGVGRAGPRAQARRSAAGDRHRGSGAGAAGPAGAGRSSDPARRRVSAHDSATAATAAAAAARRGLAAAALRPPARLVPFGGTGFAGAGVWRPVGRRVDGLAAVYETDLAPPGGGSPAGIAWMDTRLLYARLYSGSESPGGGPYRYTAPIAPAQARTLVAAFNGGFLGGSGGGYYTQGEIVHPLVAGDASLVFYSDGRVTVGAWGGALRLTRDVVGVRQNLVPLVAGGRPTPQAANPNWIVWGATCGAVSCTGPGIENQWRSGVGVTADGALVYAAGPGLSPLALARLLVRARVVEGMQLDINPDWPVFVTYRPARPDGLASPANGSKLLASTVQGPATFFDPSWPRDFITMSARRTPLR
jgi:hypothetical protein